MDTDHQTPDAIDRAIDDAVRSLTTGGPDAAFTPRVLARVATPRPVRGGRRGLVAATAVTVLITLAGTWLAHHDGAPGSTAPASARTGSSSDRRVPSSPAPIAVDGSRAATGTVTPATAAPRGAASVAVADSRGMRPDVTVGRPHVAAAKAAAASSAPPVPAVDVDPLRTIEPIAPAAITTHGLQTDDITPAPIAIDVIQVHPLSSNP